MWPPSMGSIKVVTTVTAKVNPYQTALELHRVLSLCGVPNKVIHDTGTQLLHLAFTWVGDAGSDGDGDGGGGGGGGSDDGGGGEPAGAGGYG